MRSYDETNRAVARFVKRYTEEHGFPPTMREIAEHLERTTDAAYRAVHRLIDTGCMTSRNMQPRTYVLTERGRELADGR